MSELLIPPRDPSFEDMLHNPYDGWYFGAGNPESWHYQDKLLVPEGKLLDIGIGWGRSSLFFALNGMKVVGYDQNPWMAEDLEQMVGSIGQCLNLDIEVRQQDFLKVENEDSDYDTVLLDATLNHQPSKEQALMLLDKAYQSLKPGGHIFVRALGKEDYSRFKLLYEAERGYALNGAYAEPTMVNVVDDNVIEHLCGCSGLERVEPSLFLDQLDLLTWFADKGANIVQSRSIPSDYEHNIMFGEDFNVHQPNPVLSGMLTVIAQKK